MTDERTDHDLVGLVRAGDADAYAALWTRHSGAAYGVARSFTNLDPDDLVSEAFVRVLDAIRSCGGPERAFRPYVTMTVRNIARSLHVRESALIDTDFEGCRTEVRDGELAAIAGFDRDVTSEAFKALPGRWQEVLWYHEVEGLKVGAIASLIGMPSNAVSALLVRARKGFRDAWVSAHAGTPTTPECAANLRDLGAYVHGRLSRRRRAAADAHLAGCAACRASLAEARRAASLILALLPLVVAAAAQAAPINGAPSAATPAAAATAPGAGVPAGLLVGSWAAGVVVVAAMTVGIALATGTGADDGATAFARSGTTEQIVQAVVGAEAFSAAPPEAWVAGISATPAPPERTGSTSGS